MKLLSGVALVLATLALAACGGSSDSSSSDTSSESASQEQTSTQEDTSTAKETASADGKEIFTANCASCHTLAAADASGTVGPDLDSVKLSKDVVKKHVEDGGAVMPAFSGQLSPEEIDSVSAFVSDNAGK